jgi:hypothetical protein
MSFVPTPTQANASSQSNNANNRAPVVSHPPGSGGAPPAAVSEDDEKESVFKLRTFDVYWVEKHALMYKDGIMAVSTYVCWVGFGFLALGVCVWGWILHGRLHHVFTSEIYAIVEY